MAYQRYGQHDKAYICDTHADLTELNDPNLCGMGSTCFVIDEAVKYMMNSKGEWIRQAPAAAGSSSSGSSAPDLSSYATISYVDNEIDAIQIPSIDGLATEVYVDEAVASISQAPVMKMFDEDPAIMESNPGSKFGIALNKGDTRTLPEAMLEKGVGLYNFWIHKSNTSLPEEAITKNSSCRGLCCVDTVKDTGWYGWIVLFDQDGEIYSQYIRNAEPKGWKRLMAI